MFFDVTKFYHCVSPGTYVASATYVLEKHNGSIQVKHRISSRNVSRVTGMGTAAILKVWRHPVVLTRDRRLSSCLQDFSITFYLRQKWVDERLAFPTFRGSEVLELDTHLKDRLWVPDIFFRNEKTAMLHNVTVPNHLIHLHRNGTVMYSSRSEGGPASLLRGWGLEGRRRLCVCVCVCVCARVCVRV